MRHELKTDSFVFQAVCEGKKTYEIRKNDRGYKVGDTLLLKETQHCGADMYEHNLPLIYTGREIEVTVAHILHGPIYGLQSGWCIMSFDSQLTAALAERDEAKDAATKLQKQSDQWKRLSEKMIAERDEARERVKYVDSLATWDAGKLRELGTMCGLSMPESDEEVLAVAGERVAAICRIVKALYENAAQLTTALAERDEARERVKELEDTLELRGHERDQWHAKYCTQERRAYTAWQQGAEAFICYLIDNCEGEVFLCEERLQQWYADFLKARGKFNDN